LVKISNKTMEATSLRFIDCSHKFNILSKEKSCENNTKTILNTTNEPVTLKSPSKQQTTEVSITEQSSDDSKANRFCSKCHMRQPKDHKEVSKGKENPIQCDGSCEWSHCPVKKDKISNIKTACRATSTVDMASLSKGITDPQTFMKVFAERVKPILEENNSRSNESIDNANKRRKLSEKKRREFS
jgi:hypothetical protein